MSSVAARRMLMEAARELTKTNAPAMDHYVAVLDAIATVFSYDTGISCKAVLIKDKEQK